MNLRATPILLIAFNRPTTTLEVFQHIRKAQPARLYIAADGPRLTHPDDVEKCKQVRAIKESVDWDCVVKTRYSENNQGCKKGVVSAINWFFENEEEGIILEDDIIPDDSFFSYCADMLNLYRNHEKIKAVMGFNLYGQGVKSDSHFIYEGFYPWGWATWRRAWIQYDPDYYDIDKLKALQKTKKSHKHLINTLDLNLQLIKKGLLDTWDYQFMYMMACRNGFSVAPYANLIKNIGIDGAHSSGNILNFDYGILNINNISLDANFSIDEKMNQLFLLEHKQASNTTMLKKILLNINLYKIIRNLRKKYQAYKRGGLPHKTQCRKNSVGS